MIKHLITPIIISNSVEINIFKNTWRGWIDHRWLSLTAELTLAVLAEEPGSDPSDFTTACSVCISSPWGSDALFQPSWLFIGIHVTHIYYEAKTRVYTYNSLKIVI